jgi:triosephosphate isomerase
MIAGNWKMYKTGAEAAALINELRAGLGAGPYPCDVLAAPPFTALGSAYEAIRGSAILLAGQNLHWENQGAFTGEISGPMLKEAGCTHVIIGHSERRQYFGETDETVNKRVKAAQAAGLIPIVCVGETLVERQAERTFEVVGAQLTGGLAGVPIDDPDNFLIAYEPVWAIGTGQTASPEQAQEVHAYLRKRLGELYSSAVASRTRILYGGSVKPDNARKLMGCADIDGGLVGGASLKAADFTGIIKEGAGL